MKKKTFLVFVMVVAITKIMFAQSRSPWEMNQGEGIILFGFTSPQHGDSIEYTFATIPPPDDPNWGPAPDPDIIGYSIPSTLCGVVDCRQGAQFTYFRTFVDIPSDVVITEFTISTSGVDDGIRVTIFNSMYLDGKVVPGSYVYLGGSGTADLKNLVVSGEVNTVIITHVDDCCKESYLRRVEVKLNGRVVPTLEVDCEILSPPDSSIVCCDTIKVEGKLTINGGVPPYSITCDINGVAASVIDSIFWANVPLQSDDNLIIATCTVIESSGNMATCSDSINLFRDDIPPTCAFSKEGNSIVGMFFDEHSGIATVIPLYLRNANLTVEDFNPGDKTVNFRVDPIDPECCMGFDIKVTDRCGNFSICDPILLTLSADRNNGQLEFTFPDHERYLEITNFGLNEIRVDLNGTIFKLLSDPARTECECNAYLMPEQGTVAFDLSKYLYKGENKMRIAGDGAPGSRADLILKNVAQAVDFILELQTLPVEFQLAQNYPNPFNPTTKIEYRIPARFTDGVNVQLKIYNTLGALIRTLVDERKMPGQYVVECEGKDQRGQTIPSGIYIYRLMAGGIKESKRMTFFK